MFPLHYSSDVEGQMSSLPGSVPSSVTKPKKDRAAKTKRKKTSAAERAMPRLTVIGLEQEGDGCMVECQLETSTLSVVTFKFNSHEDQPDEIAANLVSNILKTLFDEDKVTTFCLTSFLPIYLIWNIISRAHIVTMVYYF